MAGGPDALLIVLPTALPDPLPARFDSDYDVVLAWNLGHHLAAADDAAFEVRHRAVFLGPLRDR